MILGRILERDLRKSFECIEFGRRSCAREEVVKLYLSVTNFEQA
jgi:hypothetical protein